MIELVQSLDEEILSEEVYFKRRVSRDEDVKSLLEGVQNNYELFQKRSGSTQQEWQALSVFTGSGAGKTYFTFFLDSFIRSYWKDHPNEFEDLKKAYEAAAVFRVFMKQMNGTKMPEHEDPRSSNLFPSLLHC
jgi:hypothetical protein